MRMSSEKIFGTIIGLALLALLLLMIAIAFVRLTQLADQDGVPALPEEPSNSAVLRQARQAEQRADEAVASAQLILSLLEGASFLVTIALGAAAVFGFQEIRNNNQQLDLKMRQVDDTLARFERYQAPLDNLDQLQQTLKNDINSVVRLLQAYQEFSQSQNHDVAYQYAHSLLSDQTDIDPHQSEIGREILDNPVALYIAGWLEVHHISGKLDEGIAHLKKATQLEPNWATVQAAYGVGLRRKAIRTKDPVEKRSLYDAAAKELRIALERSPSLTDFNKESFHGPLGGIYRDTERKEQAIEEYQEALRITPGSSYPKGNLASLYLWQASRDGDERLLQKALTSFEETYDAAKSELREAPGNYFLLMDLSMSMMVLGYNNADYTERAFRHLEEALHVDAACTMLEVSQGGWRRLGDYCPSSTEWKATRDNIEDAIARVQEQMEVAGCLEYIGSQ